MANSRVVYISEITTGSKFRTIHTNAAKAATKAKTGIHWASCKIRDNGGNFQRPSFRDTSNPPPRITYRPFMASWIKVWPPKFNLFNRPCPWAINYNFAQRQKG